MYLPHRDKFEKVPDTLMSALGELVFALEFELTAGRKLATEDPQKVSENLSQLGFHLQMTDPLLAPHITDKSPVSK